MKRPRVTEKMLDAGLDLRFGLGWIRNQDQDHVRRARDLLRRQLEAAFELAEEDARPVAQVCAGQALIAAG